MTDAAAPTPGASPRARRAGLIAAAVWPAIAALWLAWMAYRLHRSDVSWWIGYDATWIAIGVAALAPLPVLVWAGRHRRLGPALLGFAGGGGASLVLLLAGLAGIVELRERDFRAKQARLEAFAAAVRGGDRARIRAKLAALPEAPTPAQALCALTGAPTYRHVRWLWFDRQATGPRLDGAELLTAAAAVSEGPAPREHKQAALRAVLHELASTPDAARFAEWARLWRGTLASPAQASLKLPEVEHEPNACRLGDPADHVLSRWADPGLQAWLHAGFGFEPDQFRWALRAVGSKATLERLLAAEPALAARLREDRALGTDALFSQAEAMSERLDAAARPAELADLVEALRAAGADPTGADPAWTPCDRFLHDERNSESDAIGSAERNAAAERIRVALCPAGAAAAKAGSGVR